jgi:site-specific recombinase XerD
LDGFLIAHRAAGAAQTTIAWYVKRLTHLAAYCDRRNVTTLEAIDPGLLREYLLGLACGFLTMKTDSLWGAVLIHAASDLFLFTALLARA